MAARIYITRCGVSCYHGRLVRRYLVRGISEESSAVAVVVFGPDSLVLVVGLKRRKIIWRR